MTLPNNAPRAAVGEAVVVTDDMVERALESYHGETYRMGRADPTVPPISLTILRENMRRALTAALCQSPNEYCGTSTEPTNA